MFEPGAYQWRFKLIEVQPRPITTQVEWATRRLADGKVRAVMFKTIVDARWILRVERAPNSAIGSKLSCSDIIWCAKSIGASELVTNQNRRTLAVVSLTPVTEFLALAGGLNFHQSVR